LLVLTVITRGAKNGVVLYGKLLLSYEMILTTRPSAERAAVSYLN